MKAKKSLLIVIAFISLAFSICVLCFGISSLTVHADGGENSEEGTQVVQPDTDKTIEDPADVTNNTIKEWVSVIMGGIDTVISLGLLGFLTIKKKESVSVTVNDSQTQEKLETIHNENMKLRDVLITMLTLEKGTLDVLKALYAENPNLDDKVRNIINEVSLNSESLIKDIKDIFNKENSEKVKQVLESVSSVLLG